MIFGLDLLGAARFPRIALKGLPNDWAVGVFHDTFGNVGSLVKDLAHSGKPRVIRVQLVWSDSHSFGSAEQAKAIKAAKFYEPLAKKYPEIRWQLSPFCEHNLKAIDPILREIKKAAPHCEPVNTPWNGVLSKAYLNEIHAGHHPILGPHNFSYDGKSSVDSNVTKDKREEKSAEIFFFWVPQFNLKLTVTDKTPRPERKAAPTLELIESVVFLSTKRGKVSLPKGYIWKTHSDQHEAPVPEPRACKPVLIAPQKIQKFRLVDASGVTVGELPYFGVFDGGGHRYYLGDWGYKVALEARKRTGSPVVGLFAGTTKVGEINPGFRAGTFR